MQKYLYRDRYITTTIDTTILIIIPNVFLPVATMCGTVINKFIADKPLLKLTSSDVKFGPVDVCKTKDYTFVTSQVTNQVGCFAGTTFRGLMILSREIFSQKNSILS